MNKLILAIGVPFAVLFSFSYVVTALFMSAPNSPATTTTSPEFRRCNTNGMLDGKLILVSPDVSECGYAVELVVAGQVIKGSVDGVVDPAPAGTAQIFYVQDGKFATAVIHSSK